MHDLIRVSIDNKQPVKDKPGKPTNNDGDAIAARSNLDTDNDVVTSTTTLLLLHAWSSKVLERVSIRNYKGAGLYWTGAATLTEVPQNAWIQVIRNAPTTLQGFRSTLLPETITIVLKRRNVPKLTLCRNTIRLRIGRRRIKSITSMMFVNIIRNAHAVIRKLQTNTIPHLQQSLFVSLFSVR